jgi:hypothetical protein
VKTRDRSRATPIQAVRPSCKILIDSHNEPIVMTPTLRKTLRKTGEFKRTDGIRLVHYESSKGELYTAYRWPSGQVQWYRMRVTTIVLTPQSRPAAVDIDDDLPF